MHGSYRKVAETFPALELVGRVLAEEDVAAVVSLWTGIRAAKMMEEEAKKLLDKS